ncbi:Uncharacterised protein [Shigella sonnei]|nr:Uncharacterised protein [Shigella sonnei]CST16565.1 Uncharacterised protein [Shigella sonnei]
MLVHLASIVRNKLPHGKKLPLAFMLKMVIWPYSCGTLDAFLTPACNLAVRHR